MKEQWKEIDDYPEYLVSNYGRVYSCSLNRPLKLGSNQNRHVWVTLKRNNTWISFAVHRLVAAAFVPGYFEEAVVNHKKRN